MNYFIAKAPRKKLICGVGINDADYIVKKTEKYKTNCGSIKSKLLWSCPVYSCWKRMIERVYNKKYLERRPTYKNVSICEEWLTFSNFKKWVDSLSYPTTDLVLDKDILNPSCTKIYCPEFCAFVTKRTNSFVLDFGNDSAKLVRHRTENCYESRVMNTITKKEILYYSDNYEYCRVFSINTKVDIAKILAESEPDPRIKIMLPIMMMEKYK